MDLGFKWAEIGLLLQGLTSDGLGQNSRAPKAEFVGFQMDWTKQLLGLSLASLEFTGRSFNRRGLV